MRTGMSGWMACLAQAVMSLQAVKAVEIGARSDGGGVGGVGGARCDWI